MKNRSVQVPGDGVAKMSRALAALPRGLERPGNTPVTGSFVLQLEEWRKWRDEAWDAKEGLGRGGGIGSRAHARFLEQSREQKSTGSAKSIKTSDKSSTDSPKSTKTSSESSKKPQQFSGAEAFKMAARVLAGKGIPGNRVRGLRVNPDGSFSYLFLKGSIWVPRKDRWRK